MPIRFDVSPGQNIFMVELRGVITDDELLDAYRAFLDGPEWRPGLHEFTDMSNCDMSGLTTYALRKLMDMITSIYRQKNSGPTFNAIYAPHDLPYGISRMYGSLTNEELEYTRVFRDRAESMTWLLAMANPVR